MAYGNYAQEYRKNAVNGASPVGLVIMLYDGALRFMEAGKMAMVAKDLAKQDHNLQRAQRIVLELMSTLDMAKGGDVAKNLLALYTYVVEQLMSANVEDKTEPIERAIRTMSELRESWVEIEKTTRGAPSGEAALAA